MRSKVGLANIPLLQLQLYKLGNRHKVILFEANLRGSKEKKRKYAQQNSKGNGVERQATKKKDERRAHSGAGCMRRGIRGTTINTRIKRNDDNEENTNQTHVKQHAR